MTPQEGPLLRDRRQRPFFIVDNDIWSASLDISAYGILLYCLLCRLAMQSEARVPRAYLAKLARISEGTVSNAVRELERLGLIAVERVREGRINRPSAFTLLPMPCPSPHDGQEVPVRHLMTVMRTPVIQDSLSTQDSLSSKSKEKSKARSLPKASLSAAIKVKAKALTKAKAPTKAKDSRHTPFKEAFDLDFQEHQGVPAPWGAKEGAVLAQWLSANPMIDLERWQAILRNRRASPVNHAVALSAWLGKALTWLQGLRDDWGNEVNAKGYGHGKVPHDKASRNLEVLKQVLTRRQRDRGLGQDGDFAPGGSLGGDAGTVYGLADGRGHAGIAGSHRVVSGVAAAGRGDGVSLVGHDS